MTHPRPHRRHLHLVPTPPADTAAPHLIAPDPAPAPAPRTTTAPPRRARIRTAVRHAYVPLRRVVTDRVLAGAAALLFVATVLATLAGSLTAAPEFPTAAPSIGCPLLCSADTGTDAVPESDTEVDVSAAPADLGAEGAPRKPAPRCVMFCDNLPAAHIDVGDPAPLITIRL